MAMLFIIIIYVSFYISLNVFWLISMNFKINN